MAQAVDPHATWYQEVAPRSYYNEADLERTILENLNRFYTDYHCCRFKQSLKAPGILDKRAPDLCMVAKDLKEWFIIEVELGKHSLAHVLDQIAVFKNAIFERSNARYISRQIGSITVDEAEGMMNAYPPRVLVISNEENVDWQEDINALNCEMCTFQVYHDEGGRPLYRFNGQYPLAFKGFSHCAYQSGVQYMVEVLQQNFLDAHAVRTGAKITAIYNGQASEWTRRDSGARVFLRCDSTAPPLDPLSSRYILKCDSSGLYHFSKG